MRKNYRNKVGFFVLAVSLAPLSHAAPVTVANPGFDGVVTNTFTFNSVTYHSGDAVPDHTFSSGLGTDRPLSESHTAAATGGTASIAGYDVNFSGTGILFDTRDFLSGKGPTGPGGFLTIDGSNVTSTSLAQTLVGTSFQPNTRYTLSVSVSNRSFSGVTFPGSVELVLSAGGIEQTGGTQTLVTPAVGDTGVDKLVFTTGAVAPTGDLGFKFRISGFAGGAASQAIFDNVTLDATTVPEPASLALLAVAGLLVRSRRR